MGHRLSSLKEWSRTASSCASILPAQGLASVRSGKQSIPPVSLCWQAEFMPAVLQRWSGRLFYVLPALASKRVKLLAKTLLKLANFVQEPDENLQYNMKKSWLIRGLPPSP